MSSVLSVVLPPAQARADDPSRLFSDSQKPDDERLHEAHDVDHPTAFHPHFTSKDQWQHRATALRDQVLVAEGLWPMPPRTELHPVIHGKIDRDEYTIEKVFFASYPGFYVTGNLYRPKNKSGKLPGVLCPHGHWNNGRFYDAGEEAARKQIEIGAEKTMEGARYPLQARCAMLARMGCVAFHYDMVGYADSTQIEHRKGFTDTEAVLRLQSFMGLQTWDSIRALDFLLSLPEVDPDRIAITGASGGGTQTLILSAIDDRLKVAFPAVMVSGNMQGGCICENAPLLRVGTNNIEIVGTFAPKPLGMTGANDWTRDIETKGLPELKSIYKLFGAEGDVTAKYFPFEHNYNQVSREFMYEWMNKHLKLGWPEPVKEKPFEPVPPKELSVFDGDHPRPSDAVDSTGLRKYMTETSDRQIAELGKNPSEYRRVVRTALRAMIHDHLPGRDEVVTSHAGGPKAGEGLTLETGTLGRRGAHEAVPFVALVPWGWEGSVVVWAHPDGKASLFDQGEKPNDDVQQLLERKIAVISADLFLTGEYNGKSPASPQYEGQHYDGFSYGYNRTVLAQRVHDLLTVVGLVRHWDRTKSVDLVAFGKSGPAALLARALSGDAIRSAAIDLAGFDFDQVHADNDEMILPGGIKYGGIRAFIPLCDNGKTHLFNPPKNPGPIAPASAVTLHEGPASRSEMLKSLE